MSESPLRIAAGLAAGGLFLVLVLSGAVQGLFSSGSVPFAACEASTLASGADSPDLYEEQAANAQIIVAVAEQLGLPPRAAVIGIATGQQESRLRNLQGGDRDSLGLFQQRPSQGWGDTPASPSDHRTPQERITDPVYAAKAFYARLKTVDGWQAMSLAEAAQAVQRSSYPNAYARWESFATRVVASLSARTCLDRVSLIGSPTAAASTAIAYARAQLGLPYEWAGNGPEAGDRGFDCSGLTHAAYEAAEVGIPRTAQTQYDAGPRLTAGQDPEPGDLVFFGTGKTTITHVGLIVQPGYMIDAPHPGARVRIEKVWSENLIGYSRPSANQAIKQAAA